MREGEPRVVKADPGLTTLFGRLIDEGKDVAQAEVAVVKARVGYAVTRYRTAVIFFVVAGTLALAALIAMLVGLIMTLATLVGPGLATLIVVGGTLALAAILGLIGKSRLAPEETA